MKTYQKLTSLNPSQYETITELQAHKDYIKYLLAYINSIESLDLDPEDCKSFKEWLKSEI